MTKKKAEIEESGSGLLLVNLQNHNIIAEVERQDYDAVIDLDDIAKAAGYKIEDISGWKKFYPKPNRNKLKKVS